MREVDVAEAARILREGGLVAFPTETVYGLGADATNEAAVAKVFAAKGRPEWHPLIVHLASSDDVDAWAEPPAPLARRLGDVFWPGPLTLVLRRREGVGGAVSGGLPTIALRVPSHPVALALLRELGRAIAAPSANRFGAVSPTTSAHVRGELEGRVEAYLEGGPSAIGLESTIVDLSGAVPVLLRPGGAPVEALEEVIGAPLARAGSQAHAPGMLASHYAPRARVAAVAVHELEAAIEVARARGERLAVIAPGSARVHHGVTHVSAPAELGAMARALYAMLRDLDERGVDRIIVVLPEERGLGLAIADRLRRAAAPR